MNQDISGKNELFQKKVDKVKGKKNKNSNRIKDKTYI